MRFAPRRHEGHEGNAGSEISGVRFKRMGSGCFWTAFLRGLRALRGFLSGDLRLSQAWETLESRTLRSGLGTIQVARDFHSFVKHPHDHRIRFPNEVGHDMPRIFDEETVDGSPGSAVSQVVESDSVLQASTSEEPSRVGFAAISERATPRSFLYRAAAAWPKFSADHFRTFVRSLLADGW